MGILAGGGVTITQALAVVKDTMQNYHVREAIAKLADSVQSGGTIVRPKGYEDEVDFGAELGVVIGQRCYQVSELAAANYIFGYTCVNDITARGWLNSEQSFTQWTRAKSCPTFGAIGPLIATRFNPVEARVIAKVNGETLQDYAISDMIFSMLES